MLPGKIYLCTKSIDHSQVTSHNSIKLAGCILMVCGSIQHRIAQETLNFKEEQLRDAQAWMTRAHELDALNSSTNHNLQAELRDRTDHYNQLWLACQRQVI